MTKTYLLPCIIGSFHGLRRDHIIFQQQTILEIMVLYFNIEGYNNSTIMPSGMLKDNAQGLLASIWSSSCHCKHFGTRWSNG
jgi:hypothetical protein